MHSPAGKRKVLFLIVLAGMGGLAGLLAAGALILTGRLQFDWTRRLQNTWARERAAESSRRVLVLGDSFLCTWPVLHTLKTDIQQFCDTKGVGCINTAVGGYGPYEYWDNMQAAAPNYRPGLTILFYYAGNDLTDVLYRDSPRPRSPAADAPVVQTPHASLSPDLPERLTGLFPNLTPRGFAPGFPLPLAAVALAESAPAAPAFDWDRMERQGIHPDLIQKAKNRIANPNGISPDYVNPWLLELALTNRDNFVLDILMEDPRCLPAWEKSCDHLLRINDMAAELGSEFWIVMIPATIQLDQSHFDFYRKATFIMEERFTGCTRPQDLMRRFCEKEGIEFLDLMPAFKARPDTGALYWENDDHLSEPGHIAAFEEVRKKILEPWWEANGGERSSTPDATR